MGQVSLCYYQRALKRFDFIIFLELWECELLKVVSFE